MEQTILFSPVGGTDPISQSNCCDGSLLHICRYYQPDKVYLYMSKEILNHHKEDNRYLYSLDRLAKLQGRQMQYEVLERPDLENVQEYDFFYDEFKKVIHKITEEMDATDRLLLNVSSGTPAMKSGLLVLLTMGEFSGTAIQVLTPIRRMNTHQHDGYDPELAWELNEDNAREDNRCREVKCPALSLLRDEGIIKKQLQSYNYSATRIMAESLPSERTHAYLDFLYLAEARYMMDFSRVDTLQKKLGENFLPVRSGNQRQDFEYALTLDLKWKKGEYADFVRAITPLIVALYEKILERECGIKVSMYCSESHSGQQWDKRKLADTELLGILNEAYADYGSIEFRYGPVSSDHLEHLICHKSSKDVALTDLIKEVREIEKNVRNIAAHETATITDNVIQQRTGHRAAEIMNKIKKLFSYTGMKVEKDYWQSYDRMNEIIIAKMG